MVGAFAVLTVQLARLQLIHGGDFSQRAQLNQLRIEPALPSRGLIYDRNGVPVVENVPGFSAVVVAADVPRERTLEIAGALEDLLGVPAVETVLKIEAARRSNNPFTPIIVKDGLDQPTAFRVREQVSRLPGAQITVEAVRHYIGGDVLSSILGYTGRIDEEEYATLQDDGYIASDRLGKSGVEWAYEAYLRGLPGSKQIEKDASGREIRVLVEPSQISDDQATSLAREVARKIESEMTYPGQIKVTVIRELRASEFAR